MNDYDDDKSQKISKPIEKTIELHSKTLNEPRLHWHRVDCSSNLHHHFLSKQFHDTKYNRNEKSNERYFIPIEQEENF